MGTLMVMGVAALNAGFPCTWSGSKQLSCCSHGLRGNEGGTSHMASSSSIPAACNFLQVLPLCKLMFYREILLDLSPASLPLGYKFDLLSREDHRHSRPPPSKFQASPGSRVNKTMATERNEDVAAGFAAENVKIPEGIMKPKDANVESEHHQGVEQNQLTASQQIAAGDARASQVKIPEGIMKPVSAPDSSDVAAGQPVHTSDTSETKIPEGIMKPVMS